MTIALGVVGACGRTGGSVIGILSEFPTVRLAAAVVAGGSEAESRLCLSAAKNHGLEVRYTSCLEAAVGSCDVLVDFSSPLSSLALAEECARMHKALLVGTTGFSGEQFEQLKSYGREAAILVTPNTSLGVFVLKKLALEAQRLLGPQFDVEIVELHHKMKHDVPSGTALALGRALCRGDPAALISARATEREEGQVGIASLRGGNIVGEHSVLFLGQDERLELTHRASSRTLFARGALYAALRLVEMEPGWYEMDDLYS